MLNFNPDIMYLVDTKDGSYVKFDGVINANIDLNIGMNYPLDVTITVESYERKPFEIVPYKERVLDKEFESVLFEGGEPDGR